MVEVVINEIIVLFLLVGLGFLIRKINLISSDFTKELANIIIYVTLPAKIFTSMDFPFSKDIFASGITVMAIGLIFYGVMIIIATPITKILKIDSSKQGVFKFMLVFGNVGLLGYPVMDATFGREGVFHVALFNIWFNIFLWTVGVKYMKSGNNKFNARLLINPGLIATLAGFIFFLLSIKLPSAIQSSVTLLGDSTTPMAMLVVGALLAETKITKALKETKLQIYTIIKLAIIPAAMYLVLTFLGFSGVVRAIPVILSGMPAAVNSAVFARKYESDYHFGSRGVFISTLFSLISIPLIILLVQ
ncbi:MAG: AEC family transporter [Kosmotoga sp.]|nr:MAG: AEC family transporter [Kosmotoga sp.]